MRTKSKVLQTNEAGNQRTVEQNHPENESNPLRSNKSQQQPQLFGKEGKMSLYIDMGHRTAEVCWMASLVNEKVKQHCAHLLSFFLFLSLNTSFILCASGTSNEKVVKRSRALRQLLKHRFVDLDVELFTWIWRVTIALLGIVMALVVVQPRSGFGWKKCRCGCRGKHKLKSTVRYENRVNIYKLYKY